jgi:hypothetical protein
MSELLVESPIERIAFGHGIEFFTENGAILRVEGEAEVRGADGRPIEFDAEAAAVVAPTLLGFLHRPGRFALDGASLVLTAAESELELRVDPSAEYEAWSLVLSDGSRYVCGDGGEVARWDPS